MVVTGIVPMNSKKCRIYIDNEYAFPLYNSELRKYGISEEAELAEAVYSEISELLFRRVRERILYLIGDMDRTEKNIRDRLRRSGYVGDIVDRAVDSLREYGYIDDARYAREYAESMRDNGSKGIRAIEASLAEKGVSRDIISEVMDGLAFDEDEQLLKALRKKGYSPEQLSPADAGTKRKIYGYLMRRGFSRDAISNVIRK